MAVAKLADYISDEQKKALNPEGPTETTEEQRKRNFQKSEPVHIRKLMEHMTGAQLGLMLKCSGQVCTAAVRENTIASTYEELARLIWERDYAPKPAPDLLVIVRTPPSAFVNLAAAIKDLGLNADVLTQEG